MSHAWLSFIRPTPSFGAPVSIVLLLALSAGVSRCALPGARPANKPAAVHGRKVSRDSAARARGRRTTAIASSAAVFKDVPAGHWAYTAVQELTRRKILIAAPDGKYRGEKPVTRYELAAALYRLVKALEPGRTPSKGPEARGGAASWLVSNGYLTTDSPLLQSPTAEVSPGELSDSLAYVADRILLHRASPSELNTD